MTAASDEQIVTSSEVRSELLLSSRRRLRRVEAIDTISNTLSRIPCGHADVSKERTVACRALGRGAISILVWTAWFASSQASCDDRWIDTTRCRECRTRSALKSPRVLTARCFCAATRMCRTVKGRIQRREPVAAGGGAAARPIVAVVPLKSFTGGPKEQFLADLLADDVAVRLGRIRGLEVIDCLAMRSAWNGTEDSVQNRAEAKRQLRRQRVGEQGWPPRPADGSARRQPQRNLGLGRPVRSADRRRPLGAARPHCRSRCRWHPRVFQAWMKCSTATAVPRLPRRASGGDGRPPLATTILRQDRSSTRLLAFSLLGSEDSRKGFQLRCSQRPSLLSLRFELVGHRGRERYESLSVARASAPVCRSGAQAVRRWSLAVRFHPSPRLQPQS